MPPRPNGTLPRAVKVQIWVLRPMPPNSAPTSKRAPELNSSTTPPVVRADQPCSSGIVVKPTVDVCSDEK